MCRHVAEMGNHFVLWPGRALTSTPARELLPELTKPSGNVPDKTRLGLVNVQRYLTLVKY